MCLRGLLPSLRRLGFVGESDRFDLLGELARLRVGERLDGVLRGELALSRGVAARLHGEAPRAGPPHADMAAALPGVGTAEERLPESGHATRT